MALCSSPNVEDYSRFLLPDGKTAKNAIAKAAKAIRELFSNNEERLDVLIRHGLLRDKNTKNLAKQLQENVVQDPSIFWVLVREISKFEDGAEAVMKLRGRSCLVQVIIAIIDASYFFTGLLLSANCPPKSEDKAILGNYTCARNSPRL